MAPERRSSVIGTGSAMSGTPGQRNASNRRKAPPFPAGPPDCSGPDFVNWPHGYGLTPERKCLARNRRGRHISAATANSILEPVAIEGSAGFHGRSTRSIRTRQTQFYTPMATIPS